MILFLFLHRIIVAFQADAAAVCYEEGVGHGLFKFLFGEFHGVFYALSAVSVCDCPCMRLISLSKSEIKFSS